MDKYQWCKDEGIVYTDGAGTKYCVFHAPKGKKGVLLEDFNERIFARINRAILGEQSCDLSGTVFEGDISFSKYNSNKPLPEISFNNALFNGKADFFSTNFSKVATFVKAQLEEATFASARFSIGGGGVYFNYAKFNGMANFGSAIFYGDANFTCTEFGSEVTFANAQIEMEAQFFRATFNGDANFSWSKFVKNVNFNSTKFNKGAGFYHGAEETTKTFNEDATFHDFYAKEKVRFEGVNLEKVSFLDSDLRKVDFINCEWQKKGGRNILYDDVLLFVEKGKGFWQKTWFPGFKQRNTGEIKKVEILYRRLKQKYTDEHDWPEVSNWHYGEKEMLRKQIFWRELFFYENKIFTLNFLNKILKKLTYDLYWLSSGYGEMPVSAGRMLVCLIFGISFFMYLSGFGPSSNAPVWINDLKEYYKPFVYVLNTLQYITFLKEPIFKPASLIGEYIILFSRILIPIQTALFVLAIRNRFRR